MTFGFSTMIDALSWTIVLLLGVKVIATIILLSHSEEAHFGSPMGTGLWWSTKITPLIAVPCLIAIALLQNRSGDVWVYGALMLFVLVAVPVMVWRRFRRNRVPVSEPRR